MKTGEPMNTALPLSGYLVLDLTIARAGPTAVRLLADWGADIIKIEPPPTGDLRRLVIGMRHSPDEQNLHRNKRGLTLDLKNPEGKRIFQRLLPMADIVVENFRANVKKRLGLDYETLQAINPRIILASVSGFGQDGPYSDRPGVDQIIQGMSGLMSITGEPGRGPMRAGVAISDTAAGMFLGQGILLALLHRERTGRGQWVHTSLLEAMLSKLDFQGARYTMCGEIPEQQGNHHPTQVPMGMFPSRDGFVNLAAPSNKMWDAFCRVLEAGDLLEKAEYADAFSRRANRAALEADVADVTRRFRTAELVEKLNAVGVPCGSINNVGEAFEDVQVKHLRMTCKAMHAQMGPLSLVRSPINLSAIKMPETFSRAAPDPGEHTEEVLYEFGFREEEIARLRSVGAIGGDPEGRRDE